LVNLNWD